MSDKQHVLVVGGGFGGIKAALELSKSPYFEVTLLSDRSHFRYYPTLYHTATGGRSRQSSIPLSTIFEGRNVKIITGEAETIDREQKILHLKGGEMLHYHTLVLALGVVTNYFGIKGLEEYAYGIKSMQEAERLKAHLHRQLTDDHQPDLNYIIVGGGPTGIELAGQLPQYLRHIMENHGIKHRAIHIDIIEAAPKLLPRLPKDTSRAVARQLRRLGIRLYLGQTVQAETADALMVNGKPVTSHTVIWTAGVTNHPFFKANNFALTDRGKVQVDQFLLAEPHIYVIGDNANTPFSGMAQTALHDAITIANNIERLALNRQPEAYVPHQPITVIPAGPHWAAVVWGKLHFYGYVGWLLREVADYQGFKDFEPWWQAGLQWVTEIGTEEDCPVCAVANQH